MADSLSPDRIVVGVCSDRAVELLLQVYAAPLHAGIPVVVMDIETAELVKMAANAFLATKISFINVMAEMCEALGVDVVNVTEALGLDDRIGRGWLTAGLGFGGSCLPKDIRAFRRSADEMGIGSLGALLATVDFINLSQRGRVAAMAREAVGGDLAGKKVAVLGVAFKPNSDDIRKSPSLDVCQKLLDESAIVSVHDPVAIPNATRHAGPAVRCLRVRGCRRCGPSPAPDRVGRLSGRRPRLHWPKWSPGPF